MSRHGDRRGQIADFRDSFETINWLYLLFKCGIKAKTHFEWLLWHWSSLGQLNLEPIRPNGLVGCKVPTDLVKISVKEATHMGFYYKLSLVVHYEIMNTGKCHMSHDVPLQCHTIHHTQQRATFVLLMLQCALTSWRKNSLYWNTSRQVSFAMVLVIWINIILKWITCFTNAVERNKKNQINSIWISW